MKQAVRPRLPLKSIFKSLQIFADVDRLALVS